MVRVYLYSMVVHRNDYLQVKLNLTIQSQKRNDSPLNVIEKKKIDFEKYRFGTVFGTTRTKRTTNSHAVIQFEHQTQSDYCT